MSCDIFCPSKDPSCRFTTLAIKGDASAKKRNTGPLSLAFCMTFDRTRFSRHFFMFSLFVRANFLGRASKDPVCSTHWALLVHILLRFQPFNNTMHVKCMIALTPYLKYLIKQEFININSYWWTIIARNRASRTALLELHSTNAATIVLDYKQVHNSNYVKGLIKYT